MLVGVYAIKALLWLHGTNSRTKAIICNASGMGNFLVPASLLPGRVQKHTSPYILDVNTSSNMRHEMCFFSFFLGKTI